MVVAITMGILFELVGWGQGKGRGTLGILLHRRSLRKAETDGALTRWY